MSDECIGCNTEEENGKIYKMCPVHGPQIDPPVEPVDTRPGPEVEEVVPMKWYTEESPFGEEQYVTLDYILPPSTEGRKADQGKARFDLLSPGFLWGVSRILAFGASKYEDRNWEKGLRYGRVFAALMRHLWAWWGGERLDPETGESHLYHAGCCLMFLAHFDERPEQYGEFDDRPES